MLYNGVDLPNIEAIWNTDAFSCAAIMEPMMDSGMRTCLVMGNAPTMNGTALVVSGGYEIYYIDPNGVSGTVVTEWTKSGEGTSLESAYHPMWSSVDILNADGSLYLAGSDPITGDEKYSILAGTMAAIGLAIRKLKGNKTLYKPTEMPGAIEPDVVTAIDYSGFAEGNFTATFSDGVTDPYGVQFDSENRPINVTRADGSVVPVDWGDS